MEISGMPKGLNPLIRLKVSGHVEYSVGNKSNN